MKVSIITACYNSADTIEKAIQSVLNQTYSNIEYIIVDGASTDSTLDILKKYSSISKIISEKDKGIYDALNKGIKNATGDIVGVVHSDDFLADTTIIQSIVNCFRVDPKTDAVYGDLHYVAKENTNQVIRNWVSGEYNPINFYKGWMPPHPTVFLKRELYEKFGLFRTDMRISADYELMIRLFLKNNSKMKYLNKVITKMRVGGESNRNFKSRIDANKQDRMAWQVNGLSPKWYTLYLKPLSKLKQFI